MKRRDFLKTTALGTGMIAMGNRWDVFLSWFGDQLDILTYTLLAGVCGISEVILAYCILVEKRKNMKIGMVINWTESY